MEAGFPLSTGKILVTGSTGQVGRELMSTLVPLGEIVAPRREHMDLANIESVRATIRSVRPRWIVNPAAYTAVDKAESEPDLAYAINAEAVQVIGEEARQIGAGVIHFSTDYVFDGTSTVPYVETDATGPVNVYGASKLAGEQALAQSGAAHLIFRTSWVYGAHGKNFLLAMLKLARERETLRVVADQHGAPTWSQDLANLVAHVIARCEKAALGEDGRHSAALADLSGIYHAGGNGDTTWYGFASEAIQFQLEREPETRFATIEAITTAEYPTPAKRPANSRMNSDKLAVRFGWSMMDWRESLHAVISELQPCRK